MAVAENKLPVTGLKFDTLQAAAGVEGEGLSHIGVWAADAAGCAKVDQAGATGYVVITGSTYRDDTGTCFGNFGPIEGGKGTLEAGCASGHKSVAIEQSASEAITIDGVALVRCTP